MNACVLFPEGNTAAHASSASTDHLPSKWCTEREKMSVGHSEPLVLFSGLESNASSPGNKKKQPKTQIDCVATVSIMTSCFLLLLPFFSIILSILPSGMLPLWAVTFDLLVLWLGHSQGSRVLTERLLVQLIAICIALLLSLAASVTFERERSAWRRLPARSLPSQRRIRHCLVPD